MLRIEFEELSRGLHFAAIAQNIIVFNAQILHRRACRSGESEFRLHLH
jgi:hypothetical protein